MWLWSVPEAESGGLPSQRSSIRRSAGTTRLALRSRSVRSARRLAPPIDTSSSPAPTASRPRTENSTAPLLRLSHRTALEGIAVPLPAGDKGGSRPGAQIGDISHDSSHQGGAPMTHQAHAAKREALAATVFAQLSDRELDDVARVSDERHIDAGAALCGQSDFGQEAFVIASGHVSVDVDGC